MCSRRVCCSAVQERWHGGELIGPQAPVPFGLVRDPANHRRPFRTGAAATDDAGPLFQLLSRSHLDTSPVADTPPALNAPPSAILVAGRPLVSLACSLLHPFCSPFLNSWPLAAVLLFAGFIFPPSSPSLGCWPLTALSPRSPAKNHFVGTVVVVVPPIHTYIQPRLPPTAILCFGMRGFF